MIGKAIMLFSFLGVENGKKIVYNTIEIVKCKGVER